MSRGVGAAALLAVAYALSVAAWVFGNPPGATPDEPSHYAKAVGAGRGELAGVPGPFPFVQETFHGRELEQLNRTYRGFHVPRRLRYASSLPCFAFRSGTTADCLAGDRPATAADPSLSIVGAYPPYAYVVPGVAMRLAGGRESATWLGRLGSGLVSVALLALAVWLCTGDPSPGRTAYRLLGLTLALTPMAVFMASAIGGSGTEITGGIALAAGVLRLSRPGDDPPASVWAAVGVAGLVLGLSRPLSPAWVGLAAMLFVVVAGPRRAWARIRVGGRVAVAALGLPLVGVVANLAWGAALHLSPHFSLAELPSAADKELSHMAEIGKEIIGNFGWQDTWLPNPAYLVWIVLVLGLGLAALRAGGWWERITVVAAVGVAAAVTVALGGLFVENGQSLLGRYLLPMVAALPLLAAEVVARNASRRRWTSRAGVVVPAVVVVVAGVQLLAWLVNARRYAVGVVGPVWFVPHAHWSPPGGWWPWIALATLAAAAQTGAAVLLRRARS